MLELFVGYPLLLLAVTFSVTAALSALVSAPYIYLTNKAVKILGGIPSSKANFLIESLLGHSVVWLAYLQLWRITLGGQIPILLFVLSFVLLSTFGETEEEDLSYGGKMSVGAEQWAIFIVCVYSIYTSGEIHWVI